MSDTIIRADILALAPQLSTLSDAAWVLILQFVNDFNGVTLDPTLRKLTLTLLAAHLATIAGTTGASGSVTAVISEAAGGLKRTYANPSAIKSQSAAGFNRTTYGQQFLLLTSMSISSRGPFLV